MSNHDKSKEIAAVLCRYLRAKPPKTPIRRLAKEGDPVLEEGYRLLRLAGGRKGIFESREHFVFSVILETEALFAGVASAASLCDAFSRTAHRAVATDAGKPRVPSVL